MLRPHLNEEGVVFAIRRSVEARLQAEVVKPQANSKVVGDANVPAAIDFVRVRLRVVGTLNHALVCRQVFHA